MNKELLLCPITRQIFLKPVLCADQHTYEEEAVIEWFATQDTSPATGLHLTSKTFTVNFLVKQMVDSYLEQHPESLAERHENQSVARITQDMTEEQIWTIKDDDLTALHMLFSKIKVDTKVKVFECREWVKRYINVVDPSLTFGKELYTVLHMVCKYSGDPELVRLAVECGGDPTRRLTCGWDALMLVCKHANEATMYLAGLPGVDLHWIHSDGWNLASIVSEQGTLDTVKHIASRGVDFTASKSIWSPVTMACRFNSLDVIKYLVVELELDATQKDAHGKTPLELLANNKKVPTNVLPLMFK